MKKEIQNLEAKNSFEALKMGPFLLFPKYKQKLGFCHTF